MDAVPLPEGMEMADEVPVPAHVVGPLPFNYKVNPDGGFDKFGYSNTAIAKDWRTPTERLATVFERPDSSDHLFELRAILSKEPDALLNPPPPTKDEKKVTAAAVKAERERRAALGDEARDQEDEEKKAKKWFESRLLARHALAVRIGRKAYNYGIGFTTTPSQIPAEQLTTINAEIAKVLPEDEIKLTNDQAVTWLTHAVPLTKEVQKYFNVGSSLSSYQSVTKDIYDLLLVDELDSGRFNALGTSYSLRSTAYILPPILVHPTSDLCQARDPMDNLHIHTHTHTHIHTHTHRWRNGWPPRACEALCQGDPLRPLRGDGAGERRVV